MDISGATNILLPHGQ